MYEASYAMCNDHGPQTLKTEALLQGRPGE